MIVSMNIQLPGSINSFFCFPYFIPPHLTLSMFETDDTFVYADQFVIHIYVGKENWKLIDGSLVTMAHSYNVSCLVNLGFLFPDLYFLL